MELRINAEKASIGADGAVSFLPSPGEITRFNFPSRPGIELIKAADQGKTVTPFYDGMIVQLIGHAADRKHVIRLLRDYLETATVEGISTNIPMLKRILDDPVFLAGKYDTRYLQEFTARLDAASLIREMEAAAGISGRSLTLEALRIADTEVFKVPAPSAGLFYRTPSPGEPEFVQAGDI